MAPTDLAHDACWGVVWAWDMAYRAVDLGRLMSDKAPWKPIFVAFAMRASPEDPAFPLQQRVTMQGAAPDAAAPLPQAQSEHE